MMDVKKTLAVLLTVHNRREQTIACLNNLHNQQLSADVATDIYLVDDGCTDGTANEVRKRFPLVHIIQADGTLYWNRGMHRAWQAAAQEKDYDYYLWLNDDTNLLPDAIAKMLELCEQFSNKVIIVGATISSDGDRLTYGGRVGRIIPRCDGEPHCVEEFNGNIVLVTQAVYHILGNLDYYYRHSKGDIDYGIRARKAGIKIYQCGDVLGICDAHATADGWCNPDIPLLKRWKLMHQPNGMPPCEIFHLEKQTGIIMATIHYFTIYVRCAFPRLWLRRVRY